MAKSLGLLKQIASLGRALLLTLAVTQGAQAQEGDYLGIAGPIAFLDEDWHLASASAQSEAYSRQAYLPAGETLSSYQRMFLIETVKGGLGVNDALASQLAMIEQRRDTDPLLNSEVIENQATGEVLLDFLLSGRNAAGELIVEWNAYRYAPHRFSDGSDGVVLYGFSHRGYGDDGARALLTALKDERGRLIQALAAAELPRPAN